MDNSYSSVQQEQKEEDSLIEGIDYVIRHSKNMSQIVHLTKKASEKFGEDFRKMKDYVHSLIEQEDYL